MTLKRINQIFGCIMLAFFVYIAWVARTTLRYWMVGATIGPGPGFFPFWIAIILAGLSLYWIVQITIRPGEAMPDGFIPTREGGTKVLVVFADMALFTATANLFGFPIAMFIFLFVMLVVLGHRGLRNTAYHVLFALVGTLFFTYLFGHWLEVSFPKASIGILKSLGL